MKTLKTASGDESRTQGQAFRSSRENLGATIIANAPLACFWHTFIFLSACCCRLLYASSWR